MRSREIRGCGHRKDGGSHGIGRGCQTVIGAAALLHEIGKLVLPDAALGNLESRPCLKRKWRSCTANCAPKFRETARPKNSSCCDHRTAPSRAP